MSEILVTSIYNHDIWNALDEWGLMFNLPRRPGESNRNYLRRIQSMARREINTTVQGLVNGFSVFLDLDTYDIEDRTHFYTRHTPVRSDGDGNPAEFLLRLTADGTTLPAIQLTDLPAFFAFDPLQHDHPYAFYIWEDVDGRWTSHIEFVTPPPQDWTLEITYTALRDGSYEAIHESGRTTPALTGQTGQAATMDQVRIVELSDAEMEARFIQEDGTADTETFGPFADLVTRPYRYVWGEWQWDNYRWDIDPNTGVLPSYYDAVTAPLTFFPDDMQEGVGLYPDELQLVEITEESGNPVLHGGRVYIDGHQLYCFGDPTEVIMADSQHAVQLPGQPNPDGTILVKAGRYDQLLLGQSSLGFVLTGGQDLIADERLGPHLYLDYHPAFRTPTYTHYARNALIQSLDGSLQVPTAGEGTHHHEFLMDGSWDNLASLSGDTSVLLAGDTPSAM